MVELKKTKSPGEKFFFYLAIASVFIASLACSQDTISLVALTQTAIKAEELGITVAPVFVAVSAETQVVENLDGAIMVDGSAPMNLDEDWDPLETPSAEVLPTVDLTANPPIDYVTQQGDTLRSIGNRFGVLSSEITVMETIDENRYLPVGITLSLPDRLGDTSPSGIVMPDSEVIFSPSAAAFDIQGFAEAAGGYLSGYRESTSEGTLSGSEIIYRAALRYSINPRLLLSLLEYQSGWVYSSPQNANLRNYPMGYFEEGHIGLEKQLNWTCQQLSTGYYGWRDGSLVEIGFPNKGRLRISPYLNAGSVGLEYYFAKLYNVDAWFDAVYGGSSFLELHSSMFGDYWSRAATIEPLLDDTVSQIEMALPFPEGHSWNYTGGPHQAWGDGTAWGALDFAPMGVAGCSESTDWITATHAGLVVRSEKATVVVDTDMDGSEQTGWVLFYYHVRTDGRVPAGVVVAEGDHLGHPSCEGGSATGTHVHIARKYNGEWIAAGVAGSPFILSGWQAYNGPAVYQGLMIKNEEIIKSSQVSSLPSSIKNSTEANQ